MQPQGKVKNLFILTVLLFGILAGFSLFRNRQYFASLALVPASVGDVKVETEEQSGGLTKVTLAFRTGNDSVIESISTVSLRLNISGNIAGVRILDKTGGDISTILPDEGLAATGEWEFPVNKTIVDPDKIIIDFAAVNRSQKGFSSSDYRSLATFYLSGVSQKNVLSFEFADEFSQMYSKRRPVTDVWEE